MRGAFLLFRLSLKRVRWLLVATGVLLAGFQVLRVVIATSIYKSGGFEEIGTMLPPFVRQILGPAVAGVLSFNGIVCGAYFDLGVELALLALGIALATVPASEIESGFADLILARPLRRHWLITRAIALVFFAIVLMLLMLTAGIWAGLILFAPSEAPRPPTYQIMALAVNLGMLLLCWSSVAMAFGAAFRRSVASSITSLLAFATLLLDVTQRLWEPLERIAWLSPFHYFDAFEIIMGDPLPMENLLVLGAIALTGFVLAYFLISERDICR
jgi:ABC-2 type transport system permease protein